MLAAVESIESIGLAWAKARDGAQPATLFTASTFTQPDWNDANVCFTINLGSGYRQRAMLCISMSGARAHRRPALPPPLSIRAASGQLSSPQHRTFIANLMQSLFFSRFSK